MKKIKTVPLKLEEDEHYKFKLACTMNKVTMESVLREAARCYVLRTLEVEKKAA